ncbi:MAG: hypothetical protein H0A75_05350 [Candidatus Methanofishera endochildressiae]|uniref:Uncharacterized protein n=1 Tax=Candidatus Methanofishera endochildressiae TaxID=2738884 RepID=A0A7Z0MNT0_9GAMM|nr:hypothetical protein [Candidatus Methanofishera endochildressiae]
MISNKIQQTRQNLDWLTKNLQLQHPGKQLQIKSQRLDELELRLTRINQERSIIFTTGSVLAKNMECFVYFKLDYIMSSDVGNWQPR